MLAITVIHMLPSSKRYDWDNITERLTLYDGDLMGDVDMTLLLLYFASNHLEFSKLSLRVVMDECLAQDLVLKTHKLTVTIHHDHNFLHIQLEEDVGGSLQNH